MIQIERTDASRQNITKVKALQTVCILCAGKGSRMGQMGQYLHKALFPLDGKAIISHIIDGFPRGTKFVIAIGFLGDQLRSYIRLAHNDLQVTYIDVENYENEGSGPGFSLLECEQELQKPFFFTACDTLCPGLWANLDKTQNWVGVGHAQLENSASYCNFKLKHGSVVEVFDKVALTGVDSCSFAGVAFIKDFKSFFKGLSNPDTVDGEHQVSAGIAGLLTNNKVMAKFVDWTDVGTLDKYEIEASKYEAFDFSKSDEAIYFVDGKVVKFFCDDRVSDNRVQRAKLNPKVFPEIFAREHQFYGYEFVNGSTFYSAGNPSMFADLLEWLKFELWFSVTPPKEFLNACEAFYFKKTQVRVDKFRQKYPNHNENLQINNRRIPPIDELIDNLDFDEICSGIPKFIHGDLQFDNIIVRDDEDGFLLLDWRQDFAGLLNVGDMYYDLAKLNGGIKLNYDLIKKNLFKYDENDENIYYDFAQRNSTEEYQKRLEEFVINYGLSMQKVEIITGLIYINMAPLHHEPFDKLLFALGRDQLFRTNDVMWR